MSRRKKKVAPKIPLGPMNPNRDIDTAEKHQAISVTDVTPEQLAKWQAQADEINKKSVNPVSVWSIRFAAEKAAREKK